MMPTRLLEDEVTRMERIYSARKYDTDPRYSDLDPFYLWRVQGVERATITALRRTGIHERLSSAKVLDVGCGNGRWLARWIAWGATAGNLSGVDLRSAAIEMARKALPGCHFEATKPATLPFPDNQFDVVIQNTVFSSILDSAYRANLAREMIRVARPDGAIIWYDFAYDNPANSNVKGVRVAEIRRLFPVCEISSKRITLAPPLGRYITSRSMGFATLLEWCAPFLRTHVLATIRPMK